VRSRPALLFLLLLLEEVDNEVLIVPDEFVGQAFRFQIVPKMLPPFRVEGLQRGELRWRLVSIRTTNAPGRRPRIVLVCVLRRWGEVCAW
jgi:hypothetical protein